MKKLIRIFAIVILTVGFTTCDAIDDAVDELTEVDFDTTLTDNFPVNLESGNDMDVSSSVIVSIDNNDTHDYLSKIKAVKINSLTYRVTSHNGDDTANVDVDFFADQTILMNHAIVIKDAFDTGTLFEVTDVATLNAIATKLKNGNNVTMGISGISNSEGPTNFVITVTVAVTVTASAT